VNYYLYIVECKDGMYYTGITWNIDKRIKQHNSGIKTCIQKSKRPVKLKYKQKFESIVEAAKREREIKGWSRKKKEALFEK